MRKEEQKLEKLKRGMGRGRGNCGVPWDKFLLDMEKRVTFS